MSDAIMVAIISGLLTLLGTALTVWMASRKSDENLRVTQAVMDTKIEELTREVREHNGYAKRLPVLEEQMRVANHRITDLEEICKGGKPA